jgi:putative ABC transport system permease protein
MNALAKWPKWAPSNKSGAGLTFRLALRELRGGLRGFYIFIACIALGVMAIAAVGSLANSLAEGLGREGSVILGGDVAFSLIQRETSTAERAFLASRGELSGVRGGG